MANWLTDFQSIPNKKAHLSPGFWTALFDSLGSNHPFNITHSHSSSSILPFQVQSRMVKHVHCPGKCCEEKTKDFGCHHDLSVFQLGYVRKCPTFYAVWFPCLFLSMPREFMHFPQTKGHWKCRFDMAFSDSFAVQTRCFYHRLSESQKCCILWRALKNIGVLFFFPWSCPSCSLFW